MTHRENYPHQHTSRRALPKGNEVYQLMSDLHIAFVSEDYPRVISLRYGGNSGLDPTRDEALKIMRGIAHVAPSRMHRCKKTSHARKAELESIAARYLVY